MNSEGSRGTEAPAGEKASDSLPPQGSLIVNMHVLEFAWCRTRCAGERQIPESKPLVSSLRFRTPELHTVQSWGSDSIASHRRWMSTEYLSGEELSHELHEQ